MNLDWTTAGGATPHFADQARGTNQAGVRAYNERLLLTLIRRRGALPKAEIATLTGLSAQTVSVIMRSLEAEGLVVKQKPRRGKVGQPLVPFALNPDGASVIGLKIGRRSGDLVRLDLTGAVKDKIHSAYTYPTPEAFLSFVTAGLDSLAGGLSAGERQRIAGLGVAAPFELWNWQDAVDAPHGVLEAWRHFDMQKAIEQLSPWPVYFCNDATAACAAELVFGNGAAHPDYVYFYAGYFVGGGIVLNGALVQGRTGNAGALGSMPVAGGQLIGAASLHLLERALASGGRDPGELWKRPEDWGDLGPALTGWIADAARGLAQAIVAAASVIDFSAAIIDGAIPPAVRAALVAEVNSVILGLDRRGLSPLSILPGSIGADARALGAASLPLLDSFATDPQILFKEKT